MKKSGALLTILAFSLMLLLLAGCGYGPSAVSFERDDEGTRSTYVDLGVVTTDGNRSFIPLNTVEIKPFDADYSSFIFLVLREFEDANLSLEIVSWRVERQNSTTYGIWIEHREVR